MTDSEIVAPLENEAQLRAADDGDNHSAVSSQGGPPAPAVSEKPSSKTALLLMTALAVLVADQASKVLVRDFLLSRGTTSVPLLDGWVRITYVENAGAAFGLLQNQTLLFILVGMIVVGGILFGHRFLPTHRTILALCLGLQLGGASGNLIDRLRHDGHVFDFIQVPYWPVFNVADSAVVIGVTILAYHLLFSSARTPLEGGNPGQ